MNSSSSRIPPDPLPSHTSNTGEHGTPQAMADLLSAAFASGVPNPIQDNDSTWGGFVPHDDRWYCTFRGRSGTNPGLVSNHSTLPSIALQLIKLKG